LKSTRSEFLEQQEFREIVKLSLISNSQHSPEALEVDV
jgi:hypothetical protein